MSNKVGNQIVGFLMTRLISSFYILNILSLYLVSVVVQAGLNLTWFVTPQFPHSFPCTWLNDHNLYIMSVGTLLNGCNNTCSSNLMVLTAIKKEALFNVAF